MNPAALPSLRRAFTRALARALAFALASGTALLAATPALAHHAMDGQTPETFMQGLLSGFAHPVIGLDHLAFVLALAWLLSSLPAALRLGLAAAFVGGALLGTVLHLQAVDLPASELLVALTVLAAGLLLALRRPLTAAVAWVALPLAGVLHGYAYGESIVGAEAAPLGAYLLGFSLIQLALIVGVAALLSRAGTPRVLRAGLAAGIAVTLVGAYFSLAQIAPLAA